MTYQQVHEQILEKCGPNDAAEFNKLYYTQDKAHQVAAKSENKPHRFLDKLARWSTTQKGQKYWRLIHNKIGGNY